MINGIQARYTKESSTTCNLSCGGNIGLLGIVPGESILDLGCGRGGETLQAAALAGPKGRAVGLDITPAMIDAAKAAAVGNGILNVEFLLGDIERLPFENGIFDAVISNCAINHAASKEKAYLEIHRVLKPGGRFVVSDAVTKEPLPTVVKNDPEAWAQCFGGAVTEKEYMEAVEASGFKNITILARREYVKNGFEFASLTIKAEK